MRKIFIAVAVTLVAVIPAAASDKSDVVAVLHQLVDGFNKGGDMKEALALFADQVALVDDTPPYEWNGAGAISRWKSDWDKVSKAMEVTESTVKIGKLRDFEIKGDDAYVVVPVSVTYKAKGKPMKDTGLWTMALHKGASGWRFTGAVYTFGSHSPVETAAGK